MCKEIQKMSEVVDELKEDAKCAIDLGIKECVNFDSLGNLSEGEMKGYKLLYKIFNEAEAFADSYIEYLKHLDERLDEIEKKVSKIETR